MAVSFSDQGNVGFARALFFYAFNVFSRRLFVKLSLKDTVVQLRILNLFKRKLIKSYSLN